MSGESASRPFEKLDNQQIDELGGFNECLGYQKIAVGSLAVVKLTPPKNTRYALLVVMCDTSLSDPVDVSAVIYIREDGGTPVKGVSPLGDGLPLGDLSIYEVKGIKNLKNFKMIGIRDAETHSIRIQYFG